MFGFIYLLKALASILITNSHLGNMYPSEFMALGGSFGNGLFFCISGFLLVNIKTDFASWYWGKIKRIYPTVFAGAVILLLCGETVVGNIRDFVELFIYPTKWWFVAAIVVFYILYYFIVKKQKDVIVSGSMFAVVVVYFVVYFTCMDIHSFSVEGKDLSLFKWIYYFFIMLMGAYMRKKTYSHDKKFRFFVLAAMAVVLWGALRVIFLIYPAFLPSQFLTQFMVVIFVYAMMRFGMAMETEAKFRKLCQCRIVKMLSEITLEVYIVQMIVLPFCERLCFPVNIPVAYISVFAAAYVLHFIINSKQFFTKKKERNRKGE